VTPSIDAACLVNVYGARTLPMYALCASCWWFKSQIRSPRSEMLPFESGSTHFLISCGSGSAIRSQATKIQCRTSYTIDEWVTKDVSRECYKYQYFSSTTSKVRPSSICEPGSRSGVACTHFPYKIKKRQDVTERIFGQNTHLQSKKRFQT